MPGRCRPIPGTRGTKCIYALRGRCRYSTQSFRFHVDQPTHFGFVKKDFDRISNVLEGIWIWDYRDAPYRQGIHTACTMLMQTARLDRILSSPSGSKFSLAWYKQNADASNRMGMPGILRYSWRFASTAAHTAGFWMHKFPLGVIQGNLSEGI